MTESRGPLGVDDFKTHVFHIRALLGMVYCHMFYTVYIICMVTLCDVERCMFVGFNCFPVSIASE